MSDIIRSEADHTKEGPSADELLEKSKQEYMGMWTHISELSPADSKKIVDGIQQQVFLTSEKREFIQYMKSPTPYIAMAIGVIVPILCIFLFLWYSLLLE
ncbi:hypothetical protein QPK24_14395 [Paenibacillus polygoni]|uniref:Uncharacterized protein n=1 Tax=Paenibacillus polygoni TaxID=3050112 RepID=A0ABY8WXW5_9BACL|nr:hypothetical protein [Paenibacillus polygoni]WIV17614.1 hypothetical protein QPK24_14395 [Paenibacillus polygoni]